MGISLSTTHAGLVEGKVQSRESFQCLWCKIPPLFMISLYLPTPVHSKAGSGWCLAPWWREGKRTFPFATCLCGVPEQDTAHQQVPAALSLCTALLRSGEGARCAYSSMFL